MHESLDRLEQECRDFLPNVRLRVDLDPGSWNLVKPGMRTVKLRSSLRQGRDESENLRLLEVSAQLYHDVNQASFRGPSTCKKVYAISAVPRLCAY